MSPWGAVKRRVYADYLAPDRMGEYEDLLKVALGAGYELVTMRGFHEKLTAGLLAERTMILRHDVDSDPARMADFVAVERRLGVVGTYYFRLGTLDFPLMRRIEEDGGEASYHYEEIATVIKRYRIHDAGPARAMLPAIREEFAWNLDSLRRQTGLEMTTVAGHGDFANRRLWVLNHELLDDAVRQQCGIDLDVYDPELRSRSTDITDRPQPVGWTSPPLAAIRAEAPLIHLLVHPRHWGRRIVSNTKENVLRLWQGVSYLRPMRALPTDVQAGPAGVPATWLPGG